MATTSEIAIYLSGSIKKGRSDDRNSFWTDDDQTVLRRRLAPLTVHLLNPASRSDDLSDFLGTFGRDLFQVAAADVVLADVRDRRGIGVGSEMTIARYLGIPVVSLCPMNSHYRRGNFVFLGQDLQSWTHPFVYGLSHAIVEDLAEACEWISANVPTLAHDSHPRQPDGRHIADAIQHYLRHQLQRDKEMATIVGSSARLREKRDAWGG